MVYRTECSVILLSEEYCVIAVFCSTMSAFTLDKVLLNAKNLVTRLKDQEVAVDGLLLQTQDLSKKVESMKMVSMYYNSQCVKSCVCAYSR